MADDLAEDVLLAHPPGDELTVLRAEIDDEDEFLFGDRVRHQVYYTEMEAE